MNEAGIILEAFTYRFLPVVAFCIWAFACLSVGPGKILRTIGLAFWSAGEFCDRLKSEIRLSHAIKAAASRAREEFNEGAKYA